MKSYREIQCVSFTLGTGLNFNQYTGLKHEEEDWKSRVETMREVLERACGSDKINQSSNCLKVFMAPEFFFRGRKGAYEMETCAKVTQSLQEMVNQPQYRDWLFVFGTMVGYSKDNSEKFQTYEVYNYSFIQKGFSKGKDNFVVLKEQKSAVDYLDSIYSEPDADKDVINKYNSHHLRKIKNKQKRNEIKTFPYDSNAVFEVDGICFGVEICLDNIEGRLMEAELDPQKEIQVLLVPSCGDRSVRFYDKLPASCVGFLCDGDNNGYSEVKLPDNTQIPRLENIRILLNDNVFSYGLFSSRDGVISIYTPHTLDRTLQKEVETDEGNRPDQLLLQGTENSENGTKRRRDLQFPVRHRKKMREEQPFDSQFLHEGRKSIPNVELIK